MKTLLFSMALCGMLLPLTACETPSQTAAENSVRVNHALIMDMKQIPDDTERILMVDRPVWLTRYPMPND
jgi:hypothetical protein